MPEGYVHRPGFALIARRGVPRERIALRTRLGVRVRPGAPRFAVTWLVLLVLAMRSDAPNDQDELWQFVAGQLEGREDSSR